MTQFWLILIGSYALYSCLHCARTSGGSNAPRDNLFAKHSSVCYKAENFPLLFPHSYARSRVPKCHEVDRVWPLVATEERAHWKATPRRPLVLVPFLKRMELKRLGKCQAHQLQFHLNVNQNKTGAFFLSTPTKNLLQ